MIYYQIRFKADNRWVCSRIETNEDRATWVYQEWAACCQLLRPMLDIPVRLCKIQAGVVSILETSEEPNVISRN